MIWFWARDNQQMRLETRYNNEALEFAIEIRLPDGRRETESFTDGDAFRERLIALERQFVAEAWVPFGLPERDVAENRVTSVAEKTYTSGLRAFAITLCQTAVGTRTLWTVDSVRETGRIDRELAIPGIYGVAESTEDAALARACDRIDKWLMSQYRSS